MIIKYHANHLESVLKVWFDASVKAHDFISATFWEAQVDNMRNIYVPASESYVYQKDSAVIGFYSLCENHLAAIFVAPEFQCQGIGKQLLNHAKAQRNILNLCVYRENKESYQFYLSQGFRVTGEQLDEHTGHCEYTMRWNN